MRWRDPSVAPMDNTSESLAASTHYVEYDINWGSIALIYYDWSLTFPEEVQYVWGTRFSLSTLYYIFCRYALLANVLFILSISNILGPSVSVTCDNWKRFISALSVFGRAAIIATLIGRAYAVCSRSRLILIYLTMLGAVCVVTDAFHVPAERCVDSENPPKASLLRSIFTIIFETSVAILTTFRTFQALRVGGPLSKQKHSIIYLVFEEGILYFCMISVLTIASVILDLWAPTGFLQRLLDAFTLPLSGVLTARFILHLRAWHDKQSRVVIISTMPGTPDVEAAFSHPLTLHEFGEDPVARAQRQSVSDSVTSVNVNHGTYDTEHSIPVDEPAKESFHSV